MRRSGSRNLEEERETQVGGFGQGGWYHTHAHKHTHTHTHAHTHTTSTPVRMYSVYGSDEFVCMNNINLFVGVQANSLLAFVLVSIE